MAEVTAAEVTPVGEKRTCALKRETVSVPHVGGIGPAANEEVQVNKLEREQVEKLAKARFEMFGIDDATLLAHYGPDSFNWRGCGDASMLVASILSDAQHLMCEVGTKEAVNEARQLLNRAKWVLSQARRLERETALKADTVAVYLRTTWPSSGPHHPGYVTAKNCAEQVLKHFGR